MSIHKKQPVGMRILACTELFERFSYYTLAFLLVLYASDSIEKGGLGWTLKSALYLMTLYTFAAYTLPLIGGYISDKFIGAYKASLFGALFIILGHITLFFTGPNHLPLFFFAISMVAFGTAFFKPNMPTLLGRLYQSSDYRREGGFKLYYFGINIGSALAGVSNGILKNYFGYHVALASAGIGMMIGTLILILGKKHLVTYNIKEVYENKIKLNSSLIKLSQMEIKAIKYLFIAFFFFAIWAITMQIVVSGTLSLYIENFTNRVIYSFEIPTTFFNSLEAFGVIVLSVLLAYGFQTLANRKKGIHFFTQMCLSLFITSCALVYFVHLISIVNGGVTAGLKPFHWAGFAIFILATSLSEVLISPVMMCAISVLAPLKNRSTWQAGYLLVLGLSGLVAGKIGVLSFDHPYKTFFSLMLVTILSFIIFIFILQNCISFANKYNQEQIQ